MWFFEIWEYSQNLLHTVGTQATVPTLIPSAWQHLSDICSLVLAYVFLLLIPSIFLGSALAFGGEEVAYSMTNSRPEDRDGPYLMEHLHSHN